MPPPSPHDALQAAVQAHITTQHARGEEDNPRWDSSTFKFVWPLETAPPPVLEFIAALSPRIAQSIGIGVYAGRFLPGPEHWVIDLDTDGDHGYLCLLDADGRLVTCAHREVDQLTWVPFEDLLRYAATATSARPCQ